jgi:hypothetical protein
MKKIVLVAGIVVVIGVAAFWFLSVQREEGREPAEVPAPAEPSESPAPAELPGEKSAETPAPEAVSSPGSDSAPSSRAARPPAVVAPPPAVPERTVSAADEAAVRPKPPRIEGLPPDIGEMILYLWDAKKTPLKARRGRLSSIADKDDEKSVETLMAIGKANIYLSAEAVDLLSGMYNETYNARIDKYLVERLADPEVRIARAAILAYGTRKGSEGVNEMIAALEKNRTRPDGYEIDVRTAIVKSLQEIADPMMVPGLKKEFAQADKENWDLNYGSEIVSALRVTGTKDAKAAITAYVETLSKRVPEDPMAKKYFEDKIAEAHKAASEIR